jgi:ketosteroid isomerase-like protein
MDTAEAIARFVDGLRPAFEAGDPAAAAKAAEAECVRLVEDLYRAIAGGDFAAFLDTLADDVEFENVGPAAVPFVGRWRGREEVAEAIARNFGYVEDQRPEVLSLVAQGDCVVVVARERGRYRPTGRDYDAHWVQHFTWRDGRLTRFLQVLDGASLLEAMSE